MDWSHSKILNFVKNQQDQERTKQILYENYKKIKEIYRYYSAWNPFGGIFLSFCRHLGRLYESLYRVL
jgi:hypothetical protein